MEIESSISKYYYTSAKHLFGGILFVVGFFLIAYKGYEDFADSVSNCGFLLCKLKLKDNIAGNIAGLLAIGVVLFPTTKECETTDVVGILHYISAFGFFSLLIYFCLCLFTRSKSKDMTNRKKIQKQGIQILRLYNACMHTFNPCNINIRRLQTM